MKALKFISVALTLLFVLLACKTRKEIIYEQKRDSVYVQKLIPVSLPADSSVVKALLHCDASGSVLLSRLSIETTKNARLTLLLDSLGNLQVETIIKLDTLYLPSDSIRIETVLTEFVNVPVETPLSGWQLFCLKFGRVTFWILIGSIIAAGVCLFIKLKNKPHLFRQGSQVVRVKL